MGTEREQKRKKEDLIEICPSRIRFKFLLLPRLPIHHLLQTLLLKSIWNLLQEIKQIELEENLNAGLDEEMEVSDAEEETPRKKTKKENDSVVSLKEENDSLRCQLEAYKNEVDLVRSDLRAEIDQKEKQLKLVQQTLQGMQQQLIESKKRQTEDELKVAELQARLEKEKGYKKEEKVDGDDDVTYMGESGDIGDSLCSPSERILMYLSEIDAKLIGWPDLVRGSFSTNLHPSSSAGVDYIWSYLHKMDSTIKPGDVEMLMGRFPTVFQQQLYITVCHKTTLLGQKDFHYYLMKSLMK
ncbi:uncharacterized protein LOC142326945 [Lycorma delicatula]|uniref:uncharacterized protein LOC142326943 n=1 Tax=Lycorma delicatula TaxID=130591 RepID=UPI003F51828C